MDNNIVKETRKVKERRDCDGRHSGAAVAGFSLKRCLLCDRRPFFQPALKCFACKSVFHRRCLERDSMILGGRSGTRKNAQEKPPKRATKAIRDGRCPPSSATDPVVLVDVSVQTNAVAGTDRTRGRRGRAHDAKAKRDGSSLERNTDSVVKKLHRYLYRQNVEKRLLEMEIDALNKILDSKDQCIKELEKKNKLGSSKLIVIDLRKSK